MTGTFNRLEGEGVKENSGNGDGAGVGSLQALKTLEDNLGMMVCFA